MKQDNLHEALCKLYEEYLNDYLTVERWGEDHGLTSDEARRFLALARKVRELSVLNKA